MRLGRFPKSRLFAVIGSAETSAFYESQTVSGGLKWTENETFI